jgi:hypothetical protein
MVLFFVRQQGHVAAQEIPDGNEVSVISSFAS